MSKTPNYKMIIVARQSRGLTQNELSNLTGIPQSSISRIELGNLKITDEYLEVLSKFLDYPKDFFYRDIQVYPSGSHYRKRIIIPQKVIDKVEAIMNLYVADIQELLKAVELNNSLPVLNTNNPIKPEDAAIYLRQFWKIPKGAINNLTKVVEDNGIIVVHCDFNTDKIDGRTMVTEKGQPIIFINKNLPGDRMRLTLAHELGHILLHINNVPSFNSKMDEGEAFRFAAEFLMPTREIKPFLTGKLTIELLADLKRGWKVSMQAIVYWATTMNAITSNHSRYLWTLFATRGIKKQEPIEIPKEVPTLLSEILELYFSKLQYTKKDIAKILCLHLKEFEDRYILNSNTLKLVR